MIRAISILLTLDKNISQYTKRLWSFQGYWSGECTIGIGMLHDGGLSGLG